MPVVSDGQAVGWLTLADLLAARSRILDAEQNRERVLDVRAWTRPRAPAPETRRSAE